MNKEKGVSYETPFVVCFRYAILNNYEQFNHNEEYGIPVGSFTKRSYGTQNLLRLVSTDQLSLRDKEHQQEMFNSMLIAEQQTC